MLARMALRARINHFGFIQAALAGMVAVAFIVSEVPRWTGNGRRGRRVTLAGILVMLAMGCRAIVAESSANHAAQTQPVGAGADRFYAFDPKLDETGALVNWCVERLRSIPPGATLLVLPEGVMINYLSRHERPMPEFQSDEDEYIKQLNRVRPDYVIRIWGDQRDNGIPRFGDPGQPGEKIVQWLRENYAIEDKHHGRMKWAFILRRTPSGGGGKRVDDAQTSNMLEILLVPRHQRQIMHEGGGGDDRVGKTHLADLAQCNRTRGNRVVQA
jgi:hypothetical protein